MAKSKFHCLLSMAALKIFLLSVVLTSFFCNGFSGGYLITTPKVVYTGTVQRINVHFFQNGYWDVEANLTLSKTGVLIGASKKRIRGNTEDYIDITIPDSLSVPIPYGKPNNIILSIIARSAGGSSKKLPIRKAAEMTLKRSENIVIQIEKSIYKPEQTVRVRIVGVKRDLKPVIGKVNRISIQDPRGIRLMQWDDIDFKNGIANVEMALSSQPELGEWKVVAEYKGYQVEKTFVIKKYVLSKFQVYIDTPKLLYFNSKVININICARYTHGQPVNGKLNVVVDMEDDNFKIGNCPDPGPGPPICLDYHEDECSSDIECKAPQHKCCSNNCRSLCMPAVIQKGFDTKENIRSKEPNTKRLASYVPKSISSKIKGCANFSFTNVELDLIQFKDEWWSVLKIVASVTEDFTGVKQSSKRRISVVNYQGIVVSFWVTGAPKQFKPGFPYYGQLYITSEGKYPVSDEEITIEARRGDLGMFYNKTFQVVNGFVNFDIPEMPADSRSKKVAIFAGLVDYRVISPERGNGLLLLEKKIKSAKIQSGQSLRVFFLTNEASHLKNKTLFYKLICGDNIVNSGSKRISSLRNIKPTLAEGSFELVMAHPLVSPCRLLVYYITQKGEVVADSSPLQVQNSPRNKVTVQFNQRRRSFGESVQITVKAAPGSTVVLSAIDKSLQKDKKDVNMEMFLPSEKFDNINKETLCETDGELHLKASTPFEAAGLVHMSDKNLCKEYSMYSKRSKREIKSLVQPQSSDTQRADSKEGEVPETWLWTEETVSSVTGERILTAQVPDSMTSWHLSAFAMSSTHGIGIAKPDTLTVFQPLFVSVSLPYAVIRGEKVSVVTTVFSYMTTCTTVQIQLRKNDKFQLISANDQRLCICGNATKSVKHVVKPYKFGLIPFTVTIKNVLPSLCKNPSDEPPLGISDTVVRLLRVKPQGESKEYTYSELLCPTKGTLNDEIKLDLPKDVIPGSVHATVSLSGDVMGPTLKGYDKIVKLPTGCGEQNMVNFAPNIYVMKYLNSTDLNVEDIFNKAKGFLEKGYQRELTYKRKDGSYSAFGDKDEDGSLWLTSFVLRSFSEARQFVFIDDKEIESIRQWIQSKQLRNGCFEKHGTLFRKELKGGVSTTVTLTAYVLISLLESNVDPKSDVIIKGLTCIINQQNSVTDSYSNAIIAYALTLAEHPDRPKFLKKLASKAIVKDGKMHWKKEQKPAKTPSGWVEPFHRSSSINIEMTAYALLAMIGNGTDFNVLHKAVPIVKWLSHQRNALGGFSSTQDTCMALQALSVYGRYVFGELVDYTKLHAGHGHSKVWMNVRVGDEKAFSHTFRITHKKRLAMQRIQVPSHLLPMKLLMNATGRGCALIQVDVSYYRKRVISGPSFKLSTTVRTRQDKTKALKTDAGEKLCRPLEINVCAQWLESGKSDMAVIEVKLVSGFRADEETLERLLNRADVGLMRFEIEDTKVVFYFNEIKNVCAAFGLDQTIVVENMQPASVTAYDYYDTDKSGSSVYTITDKNC